MEQFLKQTEVKNAPKIFVNNESGEAIQHDLNGAVLVDYYFLDDEAVTTKGHVTDNLRHINAMEVALFTPDNLEAKRLDDMETITLTGANFDHNVIIDVKEKGITKERLFLKTRRHLMSEQDIEKERKRVKEIENSLREYPITQSESFLPDEDENLFFGVDTAKEGEDQSVTVESKPQPVSILDKTLDSKEEAVLFIQEALGVFDDDDIENLLSQVRYQRIPDAAAAVVRYNRKHEIQIAKAQAVNKYKKELKNMLGIQESSEVDYER